MSRSKRGSTGLVDTPEYWDALAQEYTDKVCSSYDDCATNAVRDALDSVACPSAVAVDFGTGPGKVRRDGWCWEYAVTAPSQRHSVVGRGFGSMGGSTCAARDAKVAASAK